VNLILTSPPFPLQKKKAYGNVKPDEYVAWFLRFADDFMRILKPDGSLVVEFGAGWNKGEATRSIYQYKIIIELCDRFGFKVAQDFYWYNPAKLPTPAQWVTIERIRVKDAVTTVWWLSKTNKPKANNRNILVPYSNSMKLLFQRGYNKGRRPSGHVISSKFGRNNGGAIPPNLLSYSNTSSNDAYQIACRRAGVESHPARFPDSLPDFFLKFLTDPGDLVLDPFAGSNLTGAVAEKLGRRWVAMEVQHKYFLSSSFRFKQPVLLPAEIS
jgi:site-specific DNA-methyltransferase (cytosine-N4-specific)